VERFLVQYFFDLRNVVRIFDYTGGPLNSDFLIVWEEYGAVLAAYLVRKPGAATIAMTMNGVGQFFIDGFQGPHHLLYGISGLGADVIFAIFRYKRYDAIVGAFAGIASQMFWTPFSYAYHAVLQLYPLTFIESDLAVRILGGAVGDGLLPAALGFGILGLARRMRMATAANGPVIVNEGSADPGGRRTGPSDPGPIVGLPYPLRD
jgi:ABC-type thiamin/hydroxymethylpyrimidine transport system permease subunit